MLTLRTLGSLSLTGEDGEELTAILSQPKRCALLIYLTVAHPEDFVRRDTLLALFWPEQGEARARNALSQSLHFLRQHLPEGAIVSRGRDEVRIGPGTVRADAGAFESAVASGYWREALDHYTGSFLEGFHVGEAPGFEDWVFGERERLREAAAGAAWSLAREHIEVGALVEAERTAQRAMDLVCTDESPVRGFIQALASAGDRAAALNFYERFTTRLRRELDLEPSIETQEVADGIRNGIVTLPTSAFEPRDPDARPSGEAVAGPGLQGPPPDEAVPSPEMTPTRERQPHRSRGRASTVVAAVAVLGAALGLATWRPWTEATPQPTTAREYTILAEVSGSAPDATRQVVGRLVADALAEHTVLLALPGGQIRSGLAAAMKPDTTSLTVSVASELATRAGINTVVATEVDRVGAAYRVATQVTRAENDSVLARVSRQARDEDDLISVTQKLGRDLAKVLGKAGHGTEETWWRRLAARAAQPVTPSFTAYQKLMDAAAANSQRRYGEAIDLAHQALALDTGFAAAWAHLTWFYWNRGNLDSAIHAFEQVQQRPRRVNDLLMLSARATATAARGDLAEHLRLRERIYREHGAGHNNYAMALALLGRHEEAVAVMEEWCATLPYGPPENSVDNLLYWLVVLGRFEEARAWVERLSGDALVEWRFAVALAAAQWDEAERHLAPLMDLHPPGVRTASLSAVRGRIDEAFQILEQRVEAPRLRESPASINTILESALTLAVAAEHTLPWDRSLLHSDTTHRARSIAAVWASVQGDTSAAREQLASLPEAGGPALGRADRSETWLALAHARLALATGAWQEVVSLLQPLTGPRGARGSERSHRPNGLAHWTIAEAYEALGLPDSAVVHWSKLAGSKELGDDETILRGLSHSFAHRRAALAYGRLGAREKALEHWSAFLEAFTDPDPDFAWMLEEARAESARLGQSQPNTPTMRSP